MKECLLIKIFESKGEIYFRKKEAQYLKEILEERTKIVLSLGGGTPCYGKNLDLVLNNKNIESFYLKTTIPELLKRLNPKKIIDLLLVILIKMKN